MKDVYKRQEYPIQYRVNGDLYDLDLFTLDREMNRSIISNLVETKTSANSLDLSLPDGITANSSDILENGNVAVSYTHLHNINSFP